MGSTICNQSALPTCLRDQTIILYVRPAQLIFVMVSFKFSNSRNHVAKKQTNKQRDKETKKKSVISPLPVVQPAGQSGEIKKIWRSLFSLAK